MEYINKYYKFIFNLDESLVEGIINVKEFDKNSNLVKGPAFFFHTPFNDDSPEICFIDCYSLDVNKIAEDANRHEADTILLDAANRFRSRFFENTSI